MASVIHARDFEQPKFNQASAQNGVKNASDQSGPWIDVFAIISNDFGRSLHFFLDGFCCL